MPGDTCQAHSGLSARLDAAERDIKNDRKTVSDLRDLMAEITATQAVQTEILKNTVSAAEVAELKAEVAAMHSELNEIKKSLESLCAAPSRRWETLVTALITATVTALVTLAITGRL